MSLPSSLTTPDRSKPRPRPKTCRGTTTAGESCRSPVVTADGFCRLHSPTLGVDPVENGRRAGLRSGEARRARKRTLAELLAERMEAEADTFYREIRAAIARGDHEAAIDAVNRAMGVDPAELARQELIARTRDRPAFDRQRYVNC